MNREFCLLFPDFFSFLDGGEASCGLPERQIENIFRKFFRYSSPYQGYERELLHLFGLTEKQTNTSGYLANIMAAKDLGKEDAATILRADPVYLKPDQNRVFLFDGKTLALSWTDAKNLLSEVNHFYRYDSLKFSIGKEPWRWYLRGTDYDPPRGGSPLSLKGLPLEPTAVERKKMGVIKTLLTEIQMLLHSSKTNELRKKRGELPINSLWFWGSERFSIIKRTDSLSFRLLTNCDLAKNIASFIDLPNSRVLKTVNEIETDNDWRNILLIIDHTGSDFHKVFREDILGNIFNRISLGKVSKVRLITRQGHFLVTPLSGFKFWSRERAFSDIINSHYQSREVLF